MSSKYELTGWVSLSDVELNNLFTQLNKASSIFLEKEIKTRAPVDTGLLRNSVETINVTPSNFTVGIPNFIGDKDLEYAYYQNYGTRYIQPKYFMEKGLNAFLTSGKMLKLLRKLLK